MLDRSWITELEFWGMAAACWAAPLYPIIYDNREGDDAEG